MSVPCGTLLRVRSLSVDSLSGFEVGVPFFIVCLWDHKVRFLSGMVDIRPRLLLSVKVRARLVVTVVWCGVNGGDGLDCGVDLPCLMVDFQLSPR